MTPSSVVTTSLNIYFILFLLLFLLPPPLLLISFPGRTERRKERRERGKKKHSLNGNVTGSNRVVTRKNGALIDTWSEPRKLISIKPIKKSINRYRTRPHFLNLIRKRRRHKRVLVINPTCAPNRTSTILHNPPQSFTILQESPRNLSRILTVAAWHRDSGNHWIQAPGSIEWRELVLILVPILQDFPPGHRRGHCRSSCIHQWSPVKEVDNMANWNLRWTFQRSCRMAWALGGILLSNHRSRDRVRAHTHPLGGEMSAFRAFPLPIPAGILQDHLSFPWWHTRERNIGFKSRAEWRQPSAVSIAILPTDPAGSLPIRPTFDPDPMKLVACFHHDPRKGFTASILPTDPAGSLPDRHPILMLS